MYERAIKAINLRKTDRIPHLEVLDNPDFIRETSGIDPYSNPVEAIVETYKKIDLDIVLPDFIDLEPERTRIDRKVNHQDNQIVYGEWGLRGTPWITKPPIASLERILAFDPDSASRSVDELTEEYQNWVSRAQSLLEDAALVPGVDPETLLHIGTRIFDWATFFAAALKEPRRFDELLERLAHYSIKRYEAWARTDIKLLISHDDLAGTKGPFFSPEWYREKVFPWYREIWKPLKKRGIKILFISDGNIDLLVDDIFEAGADGLWIESTTNLENLAKRYGDTKIIVGNIDVRVLTFGRKEDIEAEVYRCISQAGRCPGYFFNVSGNIPQNVPVQNVRTYFDSCKKWGRRDRK